MADHCGPWTRAQRKWVFLMGERQRLPLFICKIRTIHIFYYRRFPTEAFYNHRMILGKVLEWNFMIESNLTVLSKARVFRPKAKSWRLSHSPKKIYLITSTWVITPATNDIRISSSMTFSFQQGSVRSNQLIAQWSEPICNWISVCARLQAWGTEACHRIRLARSLSFSLAYSISTSDGNLEMLSP